MHVKHAGYHKLHARTYRLHAHYMHTTFRWHAYYVHITCRLHALRLTTGSSKFSVNRSVIFQAAILDSNVFIPVTDAWNEMILHNVMLLI